MRWLQINQLAVIVHQLFKKLGLNFPADHCKGRHGIRTEYRCQKRRDVIVIKDELSPCHLTDGLKIWKRPVHGALRHFKKTG